VLVRYGHGEPGAPAQHCSCPGPHGPPNGFPGTAQLASLGPPARMSVPSSVAQNATATRRYTITRRVRWFACTQFTAYEYLPPDRHSFCTYLIPRADSIQSFNDVRETRSELAQASLRRGAE
jgi:hypothetical protein